MVEDNSYPEEYSSYYLNSVSDGVLEKLFGVGIGGKETTRSFDDEYKYEDEWVKIKKSGKDLNAIMNRKFSSFKHNSDWEFEADNRFEEAKAIAESLTNLDLEYSGISQDVSESFEVGGNGESMGRKVNSFSFVFRPKINKVPVFIEDIMIEYDADGLYQIKSRVPYSIELSKKGKIKSKEKALDEISESVNIEEADKGEVMYVLNENTGELVLAYIAESKEKKTFTVVQLEEENE